MILIFRWHARGFISDFFVRLKLLFSDTVLFNVIKIGQKMRAAAANVLYVHLKAFCVPKEQLVGIHPPPSSSDDNTLGCLLLLVYILLPLMDRRSSSMNDSLEARH